MISTEWSSAFASIYYCSTLLGYGRSQMYSSHKMCSAKLLLYYRVVACQDARSFIGWLLCRIWLDLFIGTS